MSMWLKLKNLLRGRRLNRELDAGLRSHLEEAIENGRDPDEALRSLGPTLRLREQSRDVKLGRPLRRSSPRFVPLG